VNQRELMKMLLARSSLGTPGARSLRARTDAEAVRRVLERVRERKLAAARDLDQPLTQGGPAPRYSGFLLRSGRSSSGQSERVNLALDWLASALQPPTAQPALAGQHHLVLRVLLSDPADQDDDPGVSHRVGSPTGSTYPPLARIPVARWAIGSCEDLDLSVLLVDPTDTAPLAGSYHHHTALRQLRDVDAGVPLIDAARRLSAVPTVLNADRAARAADAVALVHAVRAAQPPRWGGGQATRLDAAVARALQEAYSNLRLGRRAVSITFADAEALRRLGLLHVTPLAGLQQPLAQRVAPPSRMLQQLSWQAALADALCRVAAATQERGRIRDRVRAALRHAATLWRPAGIGDAGWSTGHDAWRRSASALRAAGRTPATPWVASLWPDPTWDDPPASDFTGGTSAAAPQDCTRTMWLVAFSVAAPPGPVGGDLELPAAAEQLRAGKCRGRSREHPAGWPT
jgi:hypothetical protein